MTRSSETANSACMADFRIKGPVNYSIYCAVSRTPHELCLLYGRHQAGGGAQPSGARRRWPKGWPCQPNVWNLRFDSWRWPKGSQVSRSVVIAMTTKIRFLTVGGILMHGAVSFFCWVAGGSVWPAFALPSRYVSPVVVFYRSLG